MTSALELTMISSSLPKSNSFERQAISKKHSLEYRLFEVTKGCFTAQTSDDDATASTELSYFSESESSSVVSSSLSASSRSVHFDLAATVTYENKIMFHDEMGELWLDAIDYKTFKRQTYTISKQMSSMEQRNRAPHSYERTLTRTYLLCAEQGSETPTTILNSADAKHLQHWAQSTPCRLGLEKWALPELQKKRSQRKQTLKRTILEIQRCKTAPPHERHTPLNERLRRSSEQLSQAGRLFAHQMAMSLAAAEAN
jgi:hypothetical protein